MSNATRSLDAVDPDEVTTRAVRSQYAYCMACHCTIHEAAHAGRYFTRANEKGRPALWLCMPPCDEQKVKARP